MVPPRPLGPPKTVATVAARPGFEPQYVQNLKTKDILIAELRQEILQKEVTIEGMLKAHLSEWRTTEESERVKSQSGRDNLAGPDELRGCDSPQPSSGRFLPRVPRRRRARSG